MIANRGWIGALVLRVQEAFLDHPDLELTSASARRRFDVNEVACEAVLDALVDADVLVKTDKGTYVRRMPHSGAWRSRPAGSGRHSTRIHPVHAA